MTPTTLLDHIKDNLSKEDLADLANILIDTNKDSPQSKEYEGMFSNIYNILTEEE